MSSMSSKANTVPWSPDVREEPEGEYSVASEKGADVRYVVDLRSTPPCSCPASQYRQGQRCKHVAAVEEFIAARPRAASMSSEAKPANMQTNPRDEFFTKLSESVPRLRELSKKAKAMDCSMLATYLDGIAGELAERVDVQKRALSGEPKIRDAARAESDLPFRVF
jgi:hypothetical protein